MHLSKVLGTEVTASLEEEAVPVKAAEQGPQLGV